MSRLLIVSNRLPISVKRAPAADGAPSGLEVHASSGGLATGLAGPHRDTNGLWIGWPGVARAEGESSPDLDTLERRLEEQRLVPVWLTRAEVHGFYDRFSNGVLWPLFHYMLDRVPRSARHWEPYRSVNEKFADAVAAVYQPGDSIWVHDYQLCLLPGLLRRRLPEARIGYFLHIPWPSVEVYRILPWRQELLEGLLGADLVGFHTFSYVRHFRQALLEILGLEADLDTIRLNDRSVRLGVFPIGIDAERFNALARSPEVESETAELRRRAGGRRILLGVDRLDYTKGLPRRLTAFARLLEDEPEWRDRVVFIQLAVPSREKVPQYRAYKSKVEALVGRINGAFGTPVGTPVRYLHRSVNPARLTALYRAADVMVVTPLRDGMNLVAKEFVASRVDDDGVLILSEMAGAASELGEALRVNPYDVDGVRRAMSRALHMPREERADRMKALRARVNETTAQRWAREFLAQLEVAETVTAGGTSPLLESDDAVERAVAPIRSAARTVLLLDYDGTLVSLFERPELARPDAALLDLLARLASRPGLRVDLVSGRGPGTLDQWFGALPVEMWAEHGYWRRPAAAAGHGAGDWQALGSSDVAWKERVLPVLHTFAARTPGSFVEEKRAGLAWHYRMADPEFGPRQARSLRAHLNDLLANEPLQVLAGHAIVEVRGMGIHKGRVAEILRAELPPDTLFAAFGDDQTDEDLFAALPAGSLSFRVGRQATRATYRLADPGAVRRLLTILLAS